MEPRSAPRLAAVDDGLLDIALTGAREAGALLLDRFRITATGVSTKSSPTDLVSDADRDAETLLVDHLTSRRPGDGILGEEGAGRGSETGLRWVIDPLDGTVNFLYRIPIWAVSIALEDNAGPVLAVVYDPNRDETFTAIRGEGASMNGHPIRTSDEADLSHALIATGFSYDPSIRSHQARVATRVLDAARDIRRSGSAALDLTSIACGRVDGFYEAHLERWDRAAGELIATEAGALVTNLQLPSDAAVGVVAANPSLHPQLSALVTETT